jgi:hypothetical protein
MKNLILCCITIAIFSCKKESTSSNPPVSTISDLPQKVIVIDSNASTNVSATTIYAFKYDTAVGKISIYEDNSSTSTPFDKLIYDFSYTNQYLSSVKKINYSNGAVLNETEHTIHRDVNNRITRITQATINSSSTISINHFYTYETSADGYTYIEDKAGFYTRYSYDYTNKLKQLKDSSSGLITHSSFIDYNNTASINKITGGFYTGSSLQFITSTFTQGSANPPLSDKLCKTLLGKDYYFQPFLINCYFLTGYIHNRVAYSITDPNYFTQMDQINTDAFTGAQLSSKNISRSIELDANNRLKKINNFSGSGTTISLYKKIEFLY